MAQKNQKLYDQELVKAVQERGGDVMKYVQLELARREAWTKYKKLRAAYMRAFVYENEAGMLRFGDQTRDAYQAYLVALRRVADYTGQPVKTTLTP